VARRSGGHGGRLGLDVAELEGGGEVRREGEAASSIESSSPVSQWAKRRQSMLVSLVTRICLPVRSMAGTTSIAGAGSAGGVETVVSSVPKLVHPAFRLRMPESTFDCRRLR
jgi:hypothetical protein